MATQDQLELVSGEGLGPFRIGALFHLHIYYPTFPTANNSLSTGSTLFNTLNILRTYKTIYPAVKVAWDEIVSFLVALSP